MTSFFDPAPLLQHSDDALRAYQSFLTARNGPGFARREVRMAEVFDAARSPAGPLPIDVGRFDRNYLAFRERDVSPDELALLAFVKINAGEAWGVECVAKARAKQQQQPGPAAEVERLITREEHFHTRLLVGAAGHFEDPDGGRLTVRGAWKPPLPLRVIIGTLVHVPQSLFHPVLLAAEVAGVFAFHWLLGRMKDLFPHAPAVRESMEQRLVEVLIDEVGHIAFNRVLVGRAGRAVARVLAQRIVWGQQLQAPEMVALGFGRDQLRRLGTFDLDALPAEVRRQAFFA